MSSIINSLIEKGVLVSPELMNKEVDENILKKIIEDYGDDLDTLNEDLIEKYEKAAETENPKSQNSSVKIIKSYEKPPKKRSFQDFVSLFNNRFNSISAILKNRQELQNVSAIARIKTKENEQVETIGMVLDKTITRNNNIIMTLEDKTGTMTVIIRDDEQNKATFNAAKDIALDEVIGVVGKKLNTAIFVQKIIFPDIPPTKELKKQKEEEYMVVLGDIHFGSKVFMKEEFQRFIAWIRGEYGNEEQREIAKKVKYILQTGDVVEGVGIYPSQEEDLEIVDIKQQYEEAAKWIARIPEDKQIIITVGNHDVGRLAEPQEKIPKDLGGALWKLPNVHLVSNPAYVNIGATENFSGFDILMYHGGSIIYYSDNIPSIRAAGGQKRADLIMQYLLQRRHLAPTYGSTLIVPDSEKDPLLIDIIPDFFLTGHIHRASVKNYRNVTMINGSCWTETTDDQVKRGLEPQPARLPIINLRTRNVKLLNFMTKTSREKEEEKLKEVEELKKKEG